MFKGKKSFFWLYYTPRGRWVSDSLIRIKKKEFMGAPVQDLLYWPNTFTSACLNSNILILHSHLFIYFFCRNRRFETTQTWSFRRVSHCSQTATIVTKLNNGIAFRKLSNDIQLGSKQNCFSFRIALWSLFFSSERPIKCSVFNLMNFILTL